MFQNTIQDWDPPQSLLTMNSPRAQAIHKSIFEEMILDLVPFCEVNKPGFLRHHALICPDFEVASDKYYRLVSSNMCSQTFIFTLSLSFLPSPAKEDMSYFVGKEGK